jgi:hypothetical protein
VYSGEEEPYIPTIGVSTAELKCIKPESFETTHSACNRISATSFRLVFPIRLIILFDSKLFILFFIEYQVPQILLDN